MNRGNNHPVMFRSWTFWRLFGTFGLLWLALIGLLGAAVVPQVDRYERERITNSVRVRAVLARDALRGRTEDAAALQEHVLRLAEDAGARLTLIADDGQV